MRQLGGTSGHWGGWCKPIEDWNLKDWPINVDEVNAYSAEASKILNIDLNFNNACNLRCKYCFTNSPKGDHVKEFLDEKNILKISHLYQQETDWHKREPGK